MSLVSDYVTCPQCGYEKADYELNCHTSEVDTQCRRCGWCLFVERIGDDELGFSWNQTKTQGSGALFYRHRDAIAYTSYYFSSDEDVLKAEEWLREKLGSGEVYADSAYLTRWNDEDKSVIFVIGTLYEFPGGDLEEPKPAKPDLRQFNVVQYRYSASVRYSCGHQATANILLLERQERSENDMTYLASDLCPVCTLGSSDALAIHPGDGSDVTKPDPLKQRDARVFENGALDGMSEFVTLAVDHPSTLEEAVARFYAMFPDRKRMHPQSIGFVLQREGWSDSDIADEKWLCDCDGCRAVPMSLGCRRV